MNNHTEPEWYRRLQTGPYTRRTFTHEHMIEIEKRAVNANTGISPARSNAFIRSVALGAAALLLIIGLLTIGDRVEGWMKENVLQQNEQPIPAAPDEPGDEQWAEPLQEETPLQLQALTGDSLWEVLPFTQEEVVQVTIRLRDGQILNIQETDSWLFGHLSYGNNAAQQATGEPDLLLRYHVGDTIYIVPYYAAVNTLDLGGGLIYGDERIAMEAHRLLHPSSPLSQYLELEARARILAEESDKAFDDSYYLTEERVNLNGQVPWTLTGSLPLDYSLPYYYYGADKLWAVDSYGDSGIVSWNDDLLVTSDKYRTADGITIGTGKAEVREKLGEPNWESELEWNYYLGRGTFLLYFDNDKVKFMYYATPL